MTRLDSTIVIASAAAFSFGAGYWIGGSGDTSNRLIAVFTVVLALVAVQTATIAARQNVITQVAGRGFLSLRVEVVLELPKSGPGGNYEIRLHLRNTGHSPIEIDSVSYSVDPPSRKGVPDFRSSYRATVGLYLAPDDAEVVRVYEIYIDTVPAQSGALLSKRVLISGVIRYRDAFGFARRRGFGHLALLGMYPHLPGGNDQKPYVTDNLTLFLPDEPGFHYDRADT